MERIVLFLTLYNIVFTLLRLIFVAFDPDNVLLKSLQFYDIAVYMLFPVFLLWTLLYLTIPVSIYYGVNGVIRRFNRFNLSVLAVNSLIFIAFIVLIITFGTCY